MASDPQAFAKIAQEQGYTPEQIDAYMKKKKIGNWIPTAGAIVGGLTGGALGTVTLPGVGTTIGGASGAALGSLGGSVIQDMINKLVNPTGPETGDQMKIRQGEELFGAGKHAAGSYVGGLTAQTLLAPLLSNFMLNRLKSPTVPIPQSSIESQIGSVDSGKLRANPEMFTTPKQVLPGNLPASQTALTNELTQMQSFGNPKTGEMNAQTFAPITTRWGQEGYNKENIALSDLYKNLQSAGSNILKEEIPSYDYWAKQASLGKTVANLLKVWKWPLYWSGKAAIK
jgi:hypothetical protein